MHRSAGILLFLLVLCSQLVRGMQNISIDDQNAQITYVPLANWTLTAPGAFDAGGAHMLTEDSNAYATFTFTGVAIYYMSSLWPYVVNTAISLDGGAPVLFDLQDHTQPNVGSGPPTAKSRIVAKADGLENKQHTVRVSVGAGQHYAILDMLIYTSLNAGDPSPATSPSPSFVPVESSASSTSSSSPSTPSTPSSGSSSIPPSSPSSSTKAHRLAIGLGIVCTLFALGLMFLAWYWRRWYLRNQSIRGGPGEVNTDGPIYNGPDIREYPDDAPLGPQNDNPHGLPVTEPAAAFGLGRRDYTGSSRRSNLFHGPGRDLQASHHDLVPSQYPYHVDGRGLEDLPPPAFANSPPRASSGTNTVTSDMPHPSLAYTSSPQTIFMTDGMSTNGTGARNSYGLPFPQSLAYAPVT